jgi:preprotein translocase subunit SecA
LTEEEEFGTIYQLDVVEIPTNKPVARQDHSDVVYKNVAGKYHAIVDQVRDCHAKGQPVLVGTISIERSELLSKLLKKEGIRHNVLNAKYHEQEAQIVAQAGKFGAVTIATNMAGRGTDIMLGGNAEFLAMEQLRKQGYADELLAEANAYSETNDEEILAIRAKYEQLLSGFKAEIAQEAQQVKAAGGLFIIGTERHESRRIDNQLRGRAGRQGDPGESRFYLSLEDDLMRLFGGGRMERIQGMMDTLGLEENTPIDANILSNAVESAQRNVESVHFRSRKNVLEYDNVMNTQREVIYQQRQKVLDGEDLRATVLKNLRSVLDTADEAELKGYEGMYYPVGSVGEDPDVDKLYELAVQTYERKEAAYTPAVMRELERVIMLRVVDEYWMDNIDAMDDLKQGIGLRAYAQHDPVVEYKNEGYEMFQAMVTAIREETVRRLFLVKLAPTQTVKRERVAKETGTGAANNAVVKKQPVKKAQKIGPNDPCPCGSGQKYKKCCMQKDKMNG